MTDILPPAGWPNVRQLETNEFATGGSNSNMNEQAKSLAARSELLKKYAALPYESKTGGYALNERVQLENGDIVKSTVVNNTDDPNVDMTGWVLDSNTVENIGELLLIQSPKNNKTVFVKSRNGNTLKGGGYFNFVVGSTKNDDGQFFATATGSWHRIILESWKNIQWWGAVGDGVTDDLPAINLAIKALKTAPDALASNASFCTLFFPVSEEAYVTTDTIYLYPWIRLKGDSPRGGSTAHNATKYSSRIGAKFPSAINYKWIIATRNIVTATGEQLPWDGTITGEQVDSGSASPCFGCSVEDLWINNLTPNNRIYGGIKFAGSPQSSVVRCWVENVDVGVVFTGSWDVRCDVGTVTHKCGVALWGSSNGIIIDGYQHAKPSVAPLPTQMPMFQTPVATTYGVYCQWTPSVSSTMLICEYFSYGIYLAASCAVSLQSYYAEANDTSCYLSSSSLDISNITGVANNYVCALGAGSRFDVFSVGNSNYKTEFFKYVDMYADSATIPDLIKVVDTSNPKVNLRNRDKSVVYVNATTGDDTWAGLLSHQPVKTINKALSILKSRVASNQWSDIANTSTKFGTICFTDSSTYSPQNYQPILNLELEFIASASNTPTLLTSSQAFKLFNSSVKVAANIKLERAYIHNGQLSQGMFICNGDCKINIQSNTVNLGYPLVSVDPLDKASVELKVMGQTGAMTSTAKYFKTASPNVYVNSFIRLNNTGFNLNAAVDNGITAPVEAWVQKSVTAVV